MHGSFSKSSRKREPNKGGDDRRDARQSNHTRHARLEQARTQELSQDGGYLMRGRVRTFSHVV